MQNSYVSDIGDFGKYALLNALAGHELRLGVNWYLNADEKNSPHGTSRITRTCVFAIRSYMTPCKRLYKMIGPKFSKSAFQLLHSQYPDSPWTRRTKYWY